MDNGGFQLNAAERDMLVLSDVKSEDVIFPLYNGKDLNNMHSLRPYRWVINFRQMSEREASSFPSAFSRVMSIVKPYREGLTGQIHETCFWKFWDYRKRLIDELAKHDTVLASARNTKYVLFRRVPTNAVYTEKAKLYLFFQMGEFAVLQSTLHQEWAAWRAATLGATTFAYSTSACLETWPMPTEGRIAGCNQIGTEYDAHREQILERRKVGLTELYNLFHDGSCDESQIGIMRELQLHMDNSVIASYGWDDLDLCHGFHETKQGMRFTISVPARAVVLQRLLRLNHVRYEEEVKLRLHDKKKNGGKRAASGEKKPRKVSTKKQSATVSFLDDEEG